MTHLTARSDSRLLIGHVNGEHHIRSPGLLTLGEEIAERRMRIGTVIFEWIEASANAEAHELVASALRRPEPGAPR